MAKDPQNFVRLDTNNRTCAAPTGFQGKITLPIIENSFNPTGLIAGTGDLYNTGATTDGNHIFVMIYQDLGPGEETFVLKSPIQPDKSLGAWSRVSDYNKPINHDNWINFGMRCHNGHLYATSREYSSGAWHFKIWRAKIGSGGTVGVWIETADLGDLKTPGICFHGNKLHLVGGKTGHLHQCRTYPIKVNGSLAEEGCNADMPFGSTRRFVESMGARIVNYGGNLALPYQRPYVGNPDRKGYITAWTPNDGTTFGYDSLETALGSSKVIRGFIMNTPGFWGGGVGNGLTFQSQGITLAGNVIGTFNQQQTLAGPFEYVGPAVYTNTHWYMPLAQATGESSTDYKTYYGIFY